MSTLSAGVVVVENIFGDIGEVTVTVVLKKLCNTSGVHARLCPNHAVDNDVLIPIIVVVEQVNLCVV